MLNNHLFNNVTNNLDVFKMQITKGGYLTLSLPECLKEFCEVTLTFESMDEIL